jgi:outer membrane protein OmpA-like peptidoglycan-associated protein
MHRSLGAPGAAVAAAIVALVGFVAIATFGAIAGCGDAAKKPGCASDKDCKSPLLCVTGSCVECTENGQCGAGKRCSGNACVADVQCTTDETCPPGQICQAGQCKACAADSECGPGGSCVAGACQRAGGKKCSKDDECADDEDCVNGTCHKAGATTGSEPTCQLTTVYFAFDDSTIQTTERDHLGGNVACLDKTKGRNILVIGHTDSSGTEEYNIALSERRAQSVADYMARLGSDPARMQVVPKGKTQPTGQGDAKDRRVEFQWH